MLQELILFISAKFHLCLIKQNQIQQLRSYKHSRPLNFTQIYFHRLRNCFLTAIYLPYCQLWTTVKQTAPLTRRWSLRYRQPHNETPVEHPVGFELATFWFLCNVLVDQSTRISMMSCGFVFSVLKHLSCKTNKCAKLACTFNARN